MISLTVEESTKIEYSPEETRWKMFNSYISQYRISYTVNDITLLQLQKNIF